MCLILQEQLLLAAIRREIKDRVSEKKMNWAAGM